MLQAKTISRQMSVASGKLSRASSGIKHTKSAPFLQGSFKGDYEGYDKGSIRLLYGPQ